MSAIAIITARGGSKRIPQKNIRDFCGRPILAYSIEAALESKLFDEVMVSTDSEEIAAVAHRYGATTPFIRSAETSGDFATTADVLREVVERYEDKGRRFDIFCCLYPTAPFVTAEKLQNAMEKLQIHQADSLVPVVKFSFPPQRAFILRDGVLTFQHPEHERSRSQDLEPMYHDCGQFYFCRTGAFLKEKTLIMKKTTALVLSEKEVQDIDSIEDWEIAEMKYRIMQERQRKAK